MTPTPAQLAAEINSDPKSLGYAARVSLGDDPGVAALLNATYVGVGAVYRINLMSRDIMASIVSGPETVALTAADWNLLQSLLLCGYIDASNPRIQALVTGLFPNTTATYTNLVAAAKVAAPSRAEELWGHTTRITATDVAHALGRG